MSEIKVGDRVVVKPGISYLNPSLYNRTFKVKELNSQWDAYSRIETVGIVLNGNVVYYARDYFVKAPDAFYLDEEED